MYGLNDGVELDNEVVDPAKEVQKEIDQEVFAEIVPGEAPELREELDIDALVIRLRDIGYVEQTVTNTGGMSQPIALESHAIIPGLITDRCPIEFYSAEVTKTRYSFALEAIEGEKKSVIKQVIDKIKEFFAKIIEWIRRAWKGFWDSRIGHEIRKSEGFLTHLENDFQNLDKNIASPSNVIRVLKRYSGGEHNYNQLVDEVRNKVAMAKSNLASSDFGAVLITNELMLDDMLNAESRSRWLFQELRTAMKGVNASADGAGRLKSVVEKINNKFDGNIKQYIQDLEDRVKNVKKLEPAAAEKYPSRNIARRCLELNRVYKGSTYDAETAIAELEALLHDSVDILTKASEANPQIVNEIADLTRQACYLAYWLNKNMLGLWSAGCKFVATCHAAVDECAHKASNDKAIMGEPIVKAWFR